MFNHKPEIINHIWTTLAFRINSCPECKTPMLIGDIIHLIKNAEPIEGMGNNFIVEQLNRAGFSYETNSTNIDGENICKKCEGFGSAVFVCSLCKTKQFHSEIQESFGSPTEHLCKKCYNTVPASDWDVEVKRLLDKHRYDFE